jgi:hypothetical protein
VLHLKLYSPNGQEIASCYVRGVTVPRAQRRANRPPYEATPAILVNVNLDVKGVADLIISPAFPPEV